jgi:hypothetical protein
LGILKSELGKGFYLLNWGFPYVEAFKPQRKVRN